MRPEGILYMMTMKQQPEDKQIIGRHTQVVFLESGATPVKAKVDTGADSSSVWASRLSVDEDGVLRFVLFDEDSPYYTGKQLTKRQYDVKVVRSSNGHEQIRYSVKLRVDIEGRRFIATFTLANRSRNVFPILIGSRLLKNKFLVDVSKNVIPDAHKKKGLELSKLAKEDPKKFFDQHYATQDHHNEKEL